LGDDYFNWSDNGEQRQTPFIGLQGIQLGMDGVLESIAARWSKPVKALRIADALLFELAEKSWRIAA
jgi:hypothetical protein